MTISDLIAQLPAALDQVGAELTTVAGLYPEGPLIRFKVRPPLTWMAGPPMLDPVGIIWYAKTGEWRGLLQGPETAIALGLDVDDAYRVLLASDVAVAGGGGQLASVREGLIAVIEGWRSQAPP